MEDLGSIPGLGRSSGEGNGNPLQYSCLENPMEGGTWWATVHRVTKSRTRLSDFTHSLTYSSILAWRIPWTAVHGVQKSQTQLSGFHFHFQSSMIQQTADNSGKGINLEGRNDAPPPPAQPAGSCGSHLPSLSLSLLNLHFIYSSLSLKPFLTLMV